jgi:hypothetical protein
MIGIADSMAAGAAGKTQLMARPMVGLTAPLSTQRTAELTVWLTVWPAVQPMTQPTAWLTV